MRPVSCFDTPPKLSWRYCLLCLLGMGVVFYSTYGGANYLAGLRDNVPEIFGRGSATCRFGLGALCRIGR